MELLYSNRRGNARVFYPAKAKSTKPCPERLTTRADRATIGSNHNGKADEAFLCQSGLRYFKKATSLEGTEYGFVGVAENGDDLDLIPADTEEEARADIDYAFAGYDTFRWLEED